MNLDGLDGVVLTSPTNGQLLKYDGTNWINDTVSGASSTLNALDDTNLTTPADSDFLVFDGTDWVNESGTTARASLGVAIGSDVQAYDAELAAIAGLTSAADKLPYFTGVGAAATTNFTTAARALLDDADSSAQRTTLGLGSISTQDSTSVNIDGGSIDGTAIGTSSASSVKATTLDATGEFTCNDNLVTRAKLKDYSESKTSLSSSSGALTLDLENGNVFEVTLTENLTTTSFNNPPASGDGGGFTLILKQDATGGRSFTWPTAVDWTNGITPTLSTAANSVDVLTFITVDGGTRWYGFLSGVNFS